MVRALYTSQNILSLVLAIQSDNVGFTADAPDTGDKEFFSSWALFILIMLLMFALFTSYILQQKKIQAVHETVLSIFAGTSIAAWLFPFGIL